MESYQRNQKKVESNKEICDSYCDEVLKREDKEEQLKQLRNEYIPKIVESLFVKSQYQNDDGQLCVENYLVETKLAEFLQNEPELENPLFIALMQCYTPDLNRKFAPESILKYFKDLDIESQDLLADQLTYVPLENIFQAVRKVTSKKLLAYCEKNINSYSSDFVVENAKKMGWGASQLQNYITNKVPNSYGVFIKHIDHFPNINKNKLVEDVFNNGTTYRKTNQYHYNDFNVNCLAQNIRSFLDRNLSFQDFLSIATEESVPKNIFSSFITELCNNSKFLTESQNRHIFNILKNKNLKEYREAFSCLIKSEAYPLSENAKNLIIEDPSNSELICNAYEDANSFHWLLHNISPELLDILTREVPSIIAKKIPYIEKNTTQSVDIESLKKYLIQKRDYGSLVANKERFFVEANDEQVFTSIEQLFKNDPKIFNFYRDILLGRIKLSGLNSDQFTTVFSNFDKLKLNNDQITPGLIYSFKDLTRQHAEILVNNSLFDHVFNNSDRFAGLEFDDKFALLLLQKKPKVFFDRAAYFVFTPRIKLLYRYGLHKKYGNDINLPKDRTELNHNGDIDEDIVKMWNFLDDNDVPRRIRQSNEVKEAVEYFVSYMELFPNFKSHAELIVDARCKCYLSPIEVIWLLKREGVAFDNIDSKTPDEIIKIMIETPDFISDQNIINHIKHGVDMFGAKVMLEYMNHPDLERHDTVYFMPALVSLYKKSGLTRDIFSDNILLQVAADNATYEEGTAHHRLATVARTLEYIDIKYTLDKLKNFNNIHQLFVLAEEFERNSPFASWKSLKKFHELVQIIHRTEMLEELAHSKTVSEKMRNYVSSLMFHPNIPGKVITQFWKEPDQFLDIEDIHTNEKLNAAKKPSNLISLPHLGLSAVSLRDAYVEGAYDRIQTLPPMNCEFYFGIPSKEETDSPRKIFYCLWKAIGQKRKEVTGLAANPDKLFFEAQKWCKHNNVKWSDLWNEEHGASVVGQASEEARKKLIDLVFDQDFGVRGRQEEFQIYRAVIGNKSDPDMVIAGNDTASCMPFGSGKNNVYMFNPNCVQMVVQRRSVDGKWRTAAQSVMNIDHEVSTLVPELMRKYLQEGVHLRDLVKKGDLERSPVLVCDNIEVAKNEEGARVARIRKVYEKFFKEYLKKNGTALGVKTGEVYVGTGYTPDALGLEKVANHFVPQAPMGYSDNIHQNAFVIKTGLSESTMQYKHGLQPMTTRDSLAISVIEGKAYSDNMTLLENLHHIQNSIIGMEVANTYLERPNLSFVYRDAKNTPKGYILAYEGETINDEEKTNFVYLSDLATDKETRMAGGRLIKGFFDKYSESYGGDKPYLPIYTNARESTSFPIIEKQTKTLCKEKGLVYKIVEIGQHQKGQDTFHDIVICIGKLEEDLAKQEYSMRRIGFT